jgi:hypothetical protein
MIFAKISPSAKFPNPNTSPLNSTLVEAEYAAAIVPQYQIGGSSKVRFRLFFVNPKFDNEGNVEGYERLGGQDIILNESEISDWGTDDSVILTKLCEKLGTQVIKFVNGNTESPSYM